MLVEAATAETGAPEMPSAFSVWVPATPSAVSPFLRWNSTTASYVACPKIPSTAPS